MLQHFYKYHGTGNDFIILNGWEHQSLPPASQIRAMCGRHTGIGADGLMLIARSAIADFKMIYFNADGLEGSMCGNGGRCLARFAVEKGISNPELVFEAVDGLHNAHVNLDSNVVSISMHDVDGIQLLPDGSCILNTGSPHYICWQNPDSTDVITEGRRIRNSDSFKKEGVNVNFVRTDEQGLTMRTYERGVEDETLSCGTGITASVLAAAFTGRISPGTERVTVNTKGGRLNVYFKKQSNSFTGIRLEGPAIKVFEGIINL